VNFNNNDNNNIYINNNEIPLFKCLLTASGLQQECTENVLNTSWTKVGIKTKGGLKAVPDNEATQAQITQLEART
jgi:hypothetical protein